MMKKHSYEVPEAELLLVSFERRFLLDSDTYSTDNSSIESGSVNNQTNPQTSIWHWDQ